MNAKEIKDLKWVELNGKRYLANVNKDESGVTTLDNSLEIYSIGGHDNREDLRKYLEVKNVDELKTITVSGNITLSVQDLTALQVEQMTMFASAMKRAKDIDTKMSENDRYRSFTN